MSINEEAWAADYLLDYLGSDPALSGMVNSVWMRSVPEAEPLPVVKMDVLERGDLMVVGLKRVWADLHFLVRGVVHWRGSGPIDWGDLKQIADRIDTLLHDHEAATSELQIGIYREETFSDETQEPTETYLHLGGIYRVFAVPL